VIPVDDFVFGDTGTESTPEQRRQELWRDPIARALDI